MGNSVSSDAVRRVITANLNQIRHCYVKLLAYAPSTTGKVRARFIIDKNGQVTTSDILDSTIGDQRFQGCITSAISSWRFAPHGATESITVTYPFLFSPI